MTREGEQGEKSRYVENTSNDQVPIVPGVARGTRFRQDVKGDQAMDAIQTLTFVALGGLLGAAGQGLRAVIGLKKQIEDAKKTNTPVKDWFDAKELVISFVLGALAGILAAVSQYEPEVELTKNLLFGLLAAGYAGADFIGGIMQKWLPSSK